MNDNTKLARSLKLTEYFTLAFGTMVGVGWLLVIDDWLTRGGPGGAMFGFLLGGLALMPVAYVYGRFVRAIPDAASEVAYASSVFPRAVGFLAGWLMTLAYLIVCPWEAVAIGKMLGYLFPIVRTGKLYELGGFPIFLPALLLGIAASLLVAFLNYRGIRLSSRFLNYTTFGLLTIFAVVCGGGIVRGEEANRLPLFAQGEGFTAALISIVLVLQIVPYFLTGFESVSKCSEEAQESFPEKDFAKAIFLGLAVGTLFYVLIIAVVSGLVPWKSIAGERYATALAFERGFGSSVPAKLIFVAALFSLFKVFNANFLTASRLIFALGRNGMIPRSLGTIHSKFQSPAAAILFCTGVTLLGPFLGDSILIPVTEVGSLCSIIGWSITCIAFIKWIRRSPNPAAKDIAIASAGAIVAMLLLVLKVAPFVPGSFGRWEYAALAAWIALGLLLNSQKERQPLRH